MIIQPFLNKIHHGDCLDLLKQVPDNSVDMTFANPPFNLKKGYKSYKDSFFKIKNKCYFACEKYQ